MRFVEIAKNTVAAVLICAAVCGCICAPRECDCGCEHECDEEEVCIECGNFCIIPDIEISLDEIEYEITLQYRVLEW